MGRIFSGIQPTGGFHIGNYLGALRNWVNMQHEHESLFCIVDLHALSTHPKPHELQKHIREVAAAYIAAGLDPDKSIIFPQSAVPAHCELAWIFACLTPLGWLNRMTQFKEKAGKQKDMANLGLYAYPVLQAADILAYKATHVPVGEDQKQHLELSRDIAGAFNRQYNQEYFELPEPVIFKTSARIMSLRDGTSKMSKTDPSEYSRIHITDDAGTIALKIRKARTDPDPIQASPDQMENRPEALNLLGIYAGFSGKNLEEVCVEFEGAQFSIFKQKLAEQIIEALNPIRVKMLSLLEDEQYLDQILQRGSDKAREIAAQNMDEIQSIIGLLRT